MGKGNRRQRTSNQAQTQDLCFNTEFQPSKLQELVTILRLTLPLCASTTFPLSDFLQHSSYKLTSSHKHILRDHITLVASMTNPSHMHTYVCMYYWLYICTVCILIIVLTFQQYLILHCTHTIPKSWMAKRHWLKPDQINFIQTI